MSAPSVAVASADAPDESPVTVVAVHGNGGGAHRFSLVGPQMPSGVELRAVTLPGFAVVPADPSLRSLRQYALLLGQLVESIPRPRVMLGHGIGGSIALELAQVLDGPELDGLILHSPVGAHLDTRWFPQLMAFPGIRELGRQLFASPLLRPIWRNMLFSGAVPRAYTDRFFDEYGTCSVFGQMFDLITPEWFARLRNVSVPTAILWGAGDSVLIVDQLQEFKRLLPDALAVRIVGWGHFPMAEAPRTYADEVATIAHALAGLASRQASDAAESAAKAKAVADARAEEAARAEAAEQNATIASWKKEV
jgi:pimeloyl-ACP methyl ester carboxylesterase